MALRWHSPLLAISVLSAGISAAIVLTSCNRNSAPQTLPQTLNEPQSQVRLGARLFTYDPDHVTELMVSKQDPTGGNSWTARLIRTGPNQPWKIASSPDGQSLTDHQADSILVNHILDALHTYHADQWAGHASLDTYGLNPPFLALRWIADGKTYEVQLGAHTPDGEGRYATLVGSPDVAITQGAVLALLDHVDSFESLRRRTLLTMDSDDVDEFELKREGKSLLYAQRETGDWVGRKHEKLRGRPGALLEGLTHLRVKSFLNDPAETRKLLAELKKETLLEAELKDRRGSPVRLSIAPQGGKLWATVSSRPDSVFEIYPESARYFTADSNPSAASNRSPNRD